MGTVFKKTYTKALPPKAEVVMGTMGGVGACGGRLRLLWTLIPICFATEVPEQALAAGAAAAATPPRAVLLAADFEQGFPPLG